jgi:very-short-patch-repair endonuclease
VAEIAARQHGVVSYEQLVWVGFTPSTISRRVREGWLHRVHRGVYAVGNPNLTREGHWMAAVLACGKGAVLSHESAAVLWGISPTSPPLIHVTVPGSNGRRRRRGIVVHRSTTLTRADTTRRRLIPVTTHPRTLRDLGYGPEPTRSDLERLFLRLCRRHGVPAPEVNVKLGPYTVDFLWRPERLVVEVDSWKYRRDRRAFESDRARDRELKLRGYGVLRFTDRELSAAPLAVVSSLQAHLRQRRPSPPGATAPPRSAGPRG